MKKNTTIKRPKSVPKGRPIKKKPQIIDFPKVEQKKQQQKKVQKKSKSKSVPKPKKQSKTKLKKSQSKAKLKKSQSKSKMKKSQSKVSDKMKKSQSISKIKQEEKKDQIKQEQKKQQKVVQQKNKKLSKRYRTKSILEQLQNYSCQLLPSKKYKIKMHNNYEIDESHKLYAHIQKLFSLFLNKQRKKSEGIFDKTRYSFYPLFEFLLAGQDQGDHKCCICQFQFQKPKQVADMERLLLDIADQDIVSLRCSHLLHLQCLKMLIGDKQWFKCPVCSMIYGKMIGDQPAGRMDVTVQEFLHCDGYLEVGTIVIHYSMHSGKRGDISFPGTGRTAYLPNNIEGNQVLQLLKEAFDRKLIFTIGRSVTTGQDNRIVWNGIHHKTNTSGGSAYFGYPDPTYFDRVKLELAAKGVF